MLELFCGDFQEALRFRAVDSEEEAGLRAELAGAQGHGIDEALRYGFRPGGESGGEQKDWVDTAHLGKDGDGDGTLGGEFDQRESASAGAGEADGGDGWVKDQCFADGVLVAVKEGEDAFGKAAGGYGALDGFADELRGAGV